MGLISNSLDSLSQKLFNPVYREWIYLNSRYYAKRAESPFRVRFMGFQLEVTDGASLVYQFKDIFYRQEYHFPCNTSDPVILDCGANIGLACLYFKRAFPGARIIALEADPRIAKMLSHNLQLNGFKDIEVIPKAVWIHNQGLEFMADGADGGHIRDLSGNSGIRVPSIRLAEILEGQPRIDLLKMDIEGAESVVLADCGERLQRVRHLYVEYHSRAGEPQQLGNVLHLLTEQGFRYFVSSVNQEIHHPPFPEISPGQIDLQLHIFAHKC